MNDTEEHEIVTLTCVRRDGGSVLRTTEVTGIVLLAPTPGHVFAMVTDPINPDAAGRMVRTSAVRAVRAFPGGIEFDTENSTYRIRYLKGGPQ